MEQSVPANLPGLYSTIDSNSFEKGKNQMPLFSYNTVNSGKGSALHTSFRQSAEINDTVLAPASAYLHTIYMPLLLVESMLVVAYFVGYHVSKR